MYESAREGSERELAAASHDVYMKVQENLQQRSMYVITPPHPTIYIYIYIYHMKTSKKPTKRWFGFQPVGPNTQWLDYLSYIIHLIGGVGPSKTYWSLRIMLASD